MEPEDQEEDDAGAGDEGANPAPSPELVGRAAMSMKHRVGEFMSPVGKPKPTVPSFSPEVATRIVSRRGSARAL